MWEFGCEREVEGVGRGCAGLNVFLTPLCTPDTYVILSFVELIKLGTRKYKNSFLLTFYNFTTFTILMFLLWRCARAGSAINDDVFSAK